MLDEDATLSTDYTLTKTRFVEGVWEGVIRANNRALPPPDVSVTLFDRALPGVVLSSQQEDDGWTLRIPVPAQVLSDGVQTFLIADARSDTLLGHFTIISGEALAEDIRAEMDLLRAELDMLKRAFRRHCLETT